MRKFKLGVMEARDCLAPKLEVLVDLKEPDGLQAILWDRTTPLSECVGDVEVSGRDAQACAQLAHQVRGLVVEWCEFAVGRQVEAKAYLAGPEAAEELRAEADIEELQEVAEEDLAAMPRLGVVWSRSTRRRR